MTKKVKFSELKRLIKESVADDVNSEIDQEVRADLKKLLNLIGVEAFLDILSHKENKLDVSELAVRYEGSITDSAVADDVDYVLKPIIKAKGYTDDDFFGCYDIRVITVLDRIFAKNSFSGYNPGTAGSEIYKNLEYTSPVLIKDVDRALKASQVVFVIYATDDILKPDAEFNPPSFDVVLDILNDKFQVVGSGKDGTLNYAVFVL